MIFYFPFTYMSEFLIGPLTGTLGPITLLKPLEKQMPAYMEKWVDAGAMQLSKPADLDMERVEQALQRFTAWASQQGGNPGDLKRFFQAAQGPGAWHLGPPTSEIRTQLRQSIDTQASAPQSDALFNASVFLALAHMYDQQQEALACDLGAVRSLEARFGEILGRTGDRKTVLGSDLNIAAARGPGDPGAFMTAQRVQSWAHVARACDVPATLFLTTSQAVWDLLREDFSEAVHVFKTDLGLAAERTEDGGQAIEEWRNTFAALAGADDPRSVSLDHLGGRQRSGCPRAPLDLCALVGLPPQEMMARYLSVAPSAPLEGMDRQIKNTLVAYVDVTALLP